jgi:protein ERP2
LRPFPSRALCAKIISTVLLCCTSARPDRFLHLTLQKKVQSGGSFDIDFDIKDPHQRVLLSGEKERQGDYVLTANTVGEYSFCFENDMSTLTDKLVDFDILVESEPRKEVPVKAGQISEHTSALEESIFRLSGMLTNIKRLQK